MPDNPYILTDHFIAEWNRIRAKVDGLRGEGVHNNLDSISIDPQDFAQDVTPPAVGETVTVAIVGVENPSAGSGGYYQGSILTGSSNGGNGGSSGNAPATYNFQILASTPQSQTDGPALQTSSGAPVVNALVVNLPEQYVAGSHKLFYTGLSKIYFAVGRVMGRTQETTPRTIVYVDSWPVLPCVVKITNTYPQSIGGTYYGEIVAGGFASSTNAYDQVIAGVAPQGITGTSDCWINNVWEQSNRVNSGVCQIPTGTYVPGLICGWPTGAYSGGGPTNKIWYQVYTWFPLQSAAPSTIIGANPITAGMSAASTYGANEQLMLNRCVTDIGNLWAMLGSFYAKMKAAGYTL